MTDTIKTINITPTWTGILPALLAAYDSGTVGGRSFARKELERLAQIADAAVEAKEDEERRLTLTEKLKGDRA